MKKYKVLLNDCGKEVNFRRWTLKEDKDLYLEINKPDLTRIQLTYVYLDFFKSLIDEKEIIDSLSKNDIFQLMIELRSYSKGNTFDYYWKCNKEGCSAKGNSQPTTFDITKDIELVKAKITELEVDEIKFQFKPITFKRELEIIEKNIATPSLIKWEILLEHIEVAFIEGQIREFTGLEDKKEFILNEAVLVGKKLSLNYDKIVSSVNITKKNICIGDCKTETKLTVGDYNFFFMLLLLA